MKKIIFFNHKGGVGKSTLTRIVADILSKDHKVLIVDLDEQLAVANSFKMLNTIKTNFKNKSLDPVWLYLTGHTPKEKTVVTIKNNIDYVGTRKNEILRLQLNTDDEDEAKEIDDRMNKLCEAYDYVFFDLPPNVDIITLKVFDIVDEIYLVLDCEIGSAIAAKDLVEQGVDTTKIKGIIPNKYLHIHRREHQKVMDDFTLEIKSPVTKMPPVKNKIAIKDQNRLAEYEHDFDEIIELIKKGEK